MALVHEVRPDQCTLVPVLAGEVTSQGGWPIDTPIPALRGTIAGLRADGIRVSVFIDPDPAAVRWAAELGADRVELFTEPFAKAFEAGPEATDAAMRACTVAAETAHQLGLGVNAGHDLDHRNLVRFRELPHLDEVSIGHALISRALFDGLSATVRAYLDVLRMTSGGMRVHEMGSPAWRVGDPPFAGVGCIAGRCDHSARLLNKESVALGVAGVLFGFLTGWIIGANRPPAPRAAGARRRRRRPGDSPAPRRPSSIRRRSTACAKRAADNPRDAAVRAEIGNVYFDAERYPEAITLVRSVARPRREERRRLDRPRRQLLLRQPGRSGARAVRALAADRAEAHQDHAEHRRRARLRQAGSDRRRVDLAAGRGHRARERRGPCREADDRRGALGASGGGRPGRAARPRAKPQENGAS